MLAGQVAYGFLIFPSTLHNQMPLQHLAALAVQQTLVHHIIFCH